MAPAGEREIPGLGGLQRVGMEAGGGPGDCTLLGRADVRARGPGEGRGKSVQREADGAPLPAMVSGPATCADAFTSGWPLRRAQAAVTNMPVWIPFRA